MTKQPEDETKGLGGRKKPPDENDRMRMAKLTGAPFGDPFENVVPIGPGVASPQALVRPSELARKLVYAPDLDEPLPPIDWLCEHYGMAPGRPILLSGFGGIGKTFAAQATAISVAAGLRTMWGSVPIEARGKVIHLDFEQGSWVTRWRYKRLCHGLGIKLRDLGSQLGVCSLPSVYLTDPRAERELTEIAEGTRLIILDNLRAACPGVDENSSTIRLYLDILNRVGEKTNTIFMVVVHEGKDGVVPRPAGQRVRGSSAITDAAGAVVSFVKEGDFIKIEHTRSNLGALTDPTLIQLVDVGDVDPMTKKTTGLRIEWVPPEQAASVTNKASPASLRTRGVVLATLQKHGPLNKRQLREFVGGKSAHSDEALQGLLREGAVRLDPGERGATIFRLP